MILMGLGTHLKVRASKWLPSKSLADATSAMAACALAVFLINPVDVIRTRIFVQPLAADGTGLLYKSVSDCFRKIVATEGVIGLYKGIGAHQARAIPHWALCMVFVGWMKRALEH